MTKYDIIVASIQPTQEELNIIAQVKRGIESDSKTSPFMSDKRWYQHFNDVNRVALTLEKAPTNKLLMVTTEKLGTLYSNDRGTSISRGSVLIKLTPTLVYCADAFYWYATPYGSAIPTVIHGYHEYQETDLTGKVKEVSNIQL